MERHCVPHFYSRASREARQELDRKFKAQTAFLLTRLSRGATPNSLFCRLSGLLFLLTRLSRGATLAIFPYKLPWHISTHAPLARRDTNVDRALAVTSNFYSRASREARPYYFFVPCRLLWISTHAPLARRDHDYIQAVHQYWHFYSRASREARRGLR